MKRYSLRVEASLFRLRQLQESSEESIDFLTGAEMKPKNFAGSPGTLSKRTTRPEMFKEFNALELYCSQCQQAVPVRKRLLLVLPDGDKYEYLCAYCSKPVGAKIDRHEKPITLIV